MAMSDNRFAIVRIVFCVLILAIQSSALSADKAKIYDAQLPAQLFTDPDMCVYAPCIEVMPGADGFSKRKGKPPYVEAYKLKEGQKKPVGYVFLSTDIVDIPGYSGKPIVTLIGMDSNGIITGAKILRHNESALQVGVSEEQFNKFIGQYVGRFVGEKVEIGASHEAQGATGLDAISGATVTTIAQNQAMLRSGVEIAKQVGIIKPSILPQGVFTDLNDRLSWNAMVAEGSIQRLTVPLRDVGVKGEGNYIDIYFGYLNAPAVGKSVLGEAGYDNLLSRLRPGEHAIFIIANGMESFKGSGFARGGIYERILIAQETDTFIFRDSDYLNLYGIEAENAPAYRESGIFIIRSSNFSSAYPWRLVFLANKMDKATGAKTFTRFEKGYWLPARYLVGGHPVVERQEPASPSVWKEKKIRIYIVILTLFLVACLMYFMRKRNRHN